MRDLNFQSEVETYLVTLDVKPETAAALRALASAKGLSVEDYLEQLEVYATLSE